jgi:hypothetical protein
MFESDKLNLMLESYTDTLRCDNYVVWATTSITTNDCYSNMSTLSSAKTDILFIFLTAVGTIRNLVTTLATRSQLVNCTVTVNIY